MEHRIWWSGCRWQCDQRMYLRSSQSMRPIFLAHPTNYPAKSYKLNINWISKCIFLLEECQSCSVFILRKPENRSYCCNVYIASGQQLLHPSVSLSRKYSQRFFLIAQFIKCLFIVYVPRTKMLSPIFLIKNLENPPSDLTPLKRMRSFPSG